MKITRFGHAALLVESGQTRLLIDPGAFSMDEVFELDDLAGVVVTHQHPDHLDVDRFALLLDRNPDMTLLCDPETADEVDRGPWTVHTEGDETVVGDLTVTGVGAEHAVILDAIPRIANVGVLVSDGTTTLFHPGDSYASTPEGVDVLAVPLSAPWAKVSDTVRFVQDVSPRTVLPIHDATIADRAYGLYWNQVLNHSGVEDARQVSPGESLVLE